MENIASTEATTRDGADHRWRSPTLGAARSVTLRQGRLEYFERGRGRPIVFAHGWLANANLWRRVVDVLADRFRCIALDLPLGSHRVALDAAADLTPAGCGALVTDVLDALELDDVTLVGTDSGGAYSQIATAARPDRIGRLVLNGCETLHDDAFPPAQFATLTLAAQQNQLRQLLSPLEDRALRATPPAYGLIAKRLIEDRVSDTYALPSLRDDGVLRDATKAMASASIAPVAAAGRRLIETYRRPVLFVWSPEDPIFPPAHAERYARALADGRMVLVDDSYSFMPEDRPAELAAAIAKFAG